MFIKPVMPHVKTNLKLKKKKFFFMSMLSNISAAAPFCSALAGNLVFTKNKEFLCILPVTLFSLFSSVPK